MKRRLLIILFLILIWGLHASWAQQGKSVIPYRIVGGKMIIEMFVNGKLQNFIFDTGGQTSLSPDLCQELGLKIVTKIQVKDVNNQSISYPVVELECLETSDKGINFKNIPVLQMGHFSFDCFGVVGLIGSDLLANMILEIDSKQPIIELQAGLGNGIKVLFDTGSSGFVSLKTSDYERLSTSRAFENVIEGYGEGGLGVAGVAKARVIHRVHFPLVSFAGTRFCHVFAETSDTPYTLLGMKLLDYGKLTIDYSRHRFYFEAYTQDNDLGQRFPDFRVRVKDGNLIVSTVWGKMRDILSVGDKVLKINGRQTKKYDFCESITQGIPELKGKRSVNMTIQTEQGEKIVRYKKK